MQIFAKDSRLVSLYLHASTSYFKTVKHVFLYTSGVWSNFTSFDAENIQQFREVAIHSSMKLTCLSRLLSHLELSQIHVCFLDFCFTIVHVHCINLYKLPVLFTIFILFFRLA